MQAFPVSLRYLVAVGLVTGLACGDGTVAAAGQKAAVGPLALKIAGPDAALYPGGVGLIVVTASRPVTVVEGTAFDRAVYFWQTSGSATEWRGLVGVGLETRTGGHTLGLRAAGADGTVVTTQSSLTVEPKSYETRRLRVAASMVDPPEEEAERITRDSKAMADAFARVLPERLWRGAFAPPVPGAATSSFGRLSVMNGQPRGRHQGADLRAPEGTPVTAPNAGRIALAQDLYFAGNTIIVDHGLGVFSLVAHLSRIDVSVDDAVGKGDRLGLSGATGRVTGPHLHWAVRMGPLSVDPLSLMRAVAGEDRSPPAR